MAFGISKGSLAGLALLAVFSCLLGVTYRAWNFDDSGIVYRVVENLVAHGEWAFNRGEVFNPTTSALHTILVALVHALGVPVALAAHIIGTVGLALLATSVFLAFRVTLPLWGALASAAAGLWVVGHGSSWGLETHLFLGTLCWISFRVRSGHPAWIELALLTLIRPDGLLATGMVALWHLKSKRSIPVRGIALFLLILSPWVAFSLYQFGQIFPDTLSNKVWQGRSGMWGHGWIYARGLSAHMTSSTDVIVNIFALLALFGIPAAFRSLPIFFLFTFAQQIIYSALNVPFYHWYVLPFDLARWLLAAYAIVFLVEWLLPRRLQKQSHGVLAGAVALCGFALFGLPLTRTPPTDARDAGYRRAVTEIRALRGEVAEVAALEVGTLGATMPTKILDLTGLATKNPELISGTHSDYFFERLPQIVTLRRPPLHFEQAVFDDVRFELAYGEIGHTDHASFPMTIYERKEDFGRESVESFVRRSYPPVLSLSPAPKPAPHKESVCVLDRVNGVPTAPGAHVKMKRTLLAITGWSGITSLPSPLGPLGIVLLNTGGSTAFSVSVSTRIPRPDVAAAIKQPEQNNCGFSFRASLLDVPAGEYQVWTLHQLQDGSERWCGPAATLQIQ